MAFSKSEVSDDTMMALSLTEWYLFAGLLYISLLVATRNLTKPSLRELMERRRENRQRKKLQEMQRLLNDP